MSGKVISRDARTGAERREVGVETPAEQIAEICGRAAAAFPVLRDLGREERARLLEAVAAELAAAEPELIAAADAETALGEGRLTGELARTCFQFRFFAEVIRDGGYLEVAIDHADPSAPPAPRPELRRMMVPIGPVAVFGASNFPLAFSVPGGDTASALAAGCPVVVKAHPAHPETSELAAAALRRALPQDVFTLVHGYEAGRALVQDPRIRAVGFTGSERGGRALFDLAVSRPDPIPFYGELGSVNPLVVTPAAARERGKTIGAGAADSLTLGMGQFCTKPGLIFVPRGESGDTLVHALVRRVGEITPGVLLTDGIRDAYVAGSYRAQQEATTLYAGEADGPACGATLVRVDTQAVIDGKAPLEEVFGPFAVVVDYDDEQDLLAALTALKPALVATVHAEESETALAGRLLDLLTERVGRIVWNGYPTGVAVAWAMTHGGPYPATTAPGHTSVGAASIRRWLRPVTYQSVPQSLLPVSLRDTSPMPRRLDGRPIL
ncbi:aldehyde dehydrogenase (NADP(+)) [Thermopolyspora sp. NPDC052614]|uniref:aldehyde dehydrogenase (NADP(+)) n=1 Tax=Thermopolyspora sp. NPDC052614 TaxID=3155682 RepID=UPI003446860A